MKIEDILIPVFGAACGVAAVSYLKGSVPEYYRWLSIIAGIGVLVLAPKYIKEEVWRTLATYAGVVLIALPVVGMLQAIPWGVIGQPPAIVRPVYAPTYAPPPQPPAPKLAVAQPPKPEEQIVSVAEERPSLITVSS